METETTQELIEIIRQHEIDIDKITKVLELQHEAMKIQTSRLTEIESILILLLKEEGS